MPAGVALPITKARLKLAEAVDAKLQMQSWFYDASGYESK